MFIDVHAHLYHESYKDIQKVIEFSSEYNVKKIICCGSDLKNSKECIEIADKFDNVYACVGVHPDDVEGFGEDELLKLEKLAKNKKVVAIGEIGLDYYTSKVAKEKQKQAFIKQLMLANKLNLPIVIHCREATGDMMELLKEYIVFCKCGVVMHCFNKNSTVAKFFLDLGCHLSVGGCLTFPHTEKLKESIRLAPLDRLLLETDCPYMTPVPFRGQTNEPKNVVIVAEEIAKIKGVSVEEVKTQTTKNAERIFKF